MKKIIITIGAIAVWIIVSVVAINKFVMPHFNNESKTASTEQKPGIIEGLLDNILDGSSRSTSGNSPFTGAVPRDGVIDATPKGLSSNGTIEVQAASLTDDLNAAKKGISGNSSDDEDSDDEYVVRNKNLVLEELEEAAEKHGVDVDVLKTYSVVGGSEELSTEMLDAFMEGISREPSFDSLEIDLNGRVVGRERVNAAKKAGLTTKTMSDAVSFPYSSDKDDDAGIWQETIDESRNPVWLYQAIDGTLNVKLYDGKLTIGEIPGNENLIAFVQSYRDAMEPNGSGVEIYMEKKNGKWQLRDSYRRAAAEYLLLLQRFGYEGVSKRQTRLNYYLPLAASLIKVLPEYTEDSTRQVNQLSCVYVAIDKDSKSISEEFGFDYLDKRFEKYGAAAAKKTTTVKKATTTKTTLSTPKATPAKPTVTQAPQQVVYTAPTTVTTTTTTTKSSSSSSSKKSTKKSNPTPNPTPPAPNPTPPSPNPSPDPTPGKNTSEDPSGQNNTADGRGPNLATDGTGDFQQTMPPLPTSSNPAETQYQPVALPQNSALTNGLVTDTTAEGGTGSINIPVGSLPAPGTSIPAPAGTTTVIIDPVSGGVTSVPVDNGVITSRESAGGQTVTDLRGTITTTDSSGSTTTKQSFTENYQAESAPIAVQDDTSGGRNGTSKSNKGVPGRKK